jgi:hypothetical protein
VRSRTSRRSRKPPNLGDCERARAEYEKLTGQSGTIGEAARRGLAECRATSAAERLEPQVGDPPTEPERQQGAEDPAAASLTGAADGTPTAGFADVK